MGASWRANWRVKHCGCAALALAVAFIFSAGAAAQGVEQRYRISGTIVDGRNGHALAGAKVTIWPTGRREAGRSVITGTTGEFLFEDLAATQYRVFAARRGYASRLYKQHESYSSAVVTGPGKTSDGIRLALLPGAVISGIALDESNDAIRNGTVTLFCEKLAGGTYQPEEQDQTNTDDEGRYRFTGLDPGDYLVRLRAQPWYADGIGVRDTPNLDSSRHDQGRNPDDVALDVIYPDMYFSGAAWESAASPVHVGWGDQAAADFSIHPVPSLHLLVRHKIGSEIDVAQNRAGFTMNLGHRGSDAATEVTDIGGLMPGPVRLSVPSSSDDQPATTRVLELSANAEVDSAALPDYVKISGVVKTSEGAILREPSRIWLQRPRSSEWRFDARADASGQFHFAEAVVSPGIYDVWVEEPEGAVVVAVTASGATATGHAVTIGAQRDVKLAVTIAKGIGQVSGVAMRDAQAVDGVMMLLVPLDFGGLASLYRRDESDSDGTFTLSGVVPGKYLAVGIADGWDLEWGKAEVLAKYLARGTKVVVGKDGISNVRVEVQ
jgi:hypothetical protein